MGNKCFKDSKSKRYNKNKSRYNDNKYPEDNYNQYKNNNISDLIDENILKESNLNPYNNNSYYLDNNDISININQENGLVEINNSIAHNNLYNNNTIKLRQLSENMSVNINDISNPNNLANIYKINNISFFNYNSEKIIDVFNIIKKLGNGTFGKCYLSRLRKGNKDAMFAIKSISLKDVDKNQLFIFKTEITCLKKLIHPNIVHFHQLYYDHCEVHMVMEPCMNGSLFDKIVEKGSFSERSAIKIMITLLSSLNYCHKNNVIHRDIKPENILLVKNNNLNNNKDSAFPVENIDYEYDLRLIDFGLSHMYIKKDNSAYNSLLSSSVGSPYFMAPEVLNQCYNSKCDIWSMGILFYFLIAGIPPFYSENIPDLFKKIISDKPSFESSKWKNISNNTKDCIKSMLCKEFKERPSCEQVLKHMCFESELSKQHNIQKLYAFEQVVNALIDYYKFKNRFIKEVCSYMISQLSSNDLRWCSAMFKTIDVNNNGFAPIETLITHLKEKKLDYYVFEKYNNISHLCYSDILEACAYKKLHSKEFLKCAFKCLDIDEDESINFKDFSSSIFKNASKISPIEICEIISDIGLSKNFKISFKEFEQIVLRN